MKRPIFAVTGDNHLRPQTWVKHPTISRDAYHSFKQIIDYCVMHSLPLIILGDLFDKDHPDAGSVSFFIYQMSVMRAANLPVYFVDGNHDYSDPSWALVGQWPTPLHHNTVDIGGLRAYGINYTRPEMLQAELEAVPAYTQLLCMHQSWLEIQRVGHVDASFGQLPPVLLLTGDYHVHGKYEGIGNNGQPRIAWSPGSTCLQALNEPVDKFFYVFHYDPINLEFDAESVQLDTRRVHKYELTTPADLDNMIREITAATPAIITPILQVRYADNIPEVYNRVIAATTGGKFHVFFEPRHITIETVIDCDATPEGSFEGLIEAVGQLCHGRPDLYNALERLLNANTPADELKLICTEFLEQLRAQAQSQTQVQAAV
jgi:hypothetical protein